jgi:DNA-binding response OmpR family regulator
VDAHATAVQVVEDDDEVRAVISELLSDNGFNVQTAATGREAIAIIDDVPVDLMVADIGLPGGLDGLEIARCARKRRPSLKCLFISGRHEPVVCDRERDDFMAKPFRRPELLGCVWKVLRGNFPRPRLAVAVAH